MLLPRTSARRRSASRRSRRPSPRWRASRRRPSRRTTPECSRTWKRRSSAWSTARTRRSFRSSSIKLARAGLREPEKPIGCYLFSGPTGVSKTEVAKQLSELLGVELIRFDMSEYMERHAVSRLIGAPPGYVGFDQGASDRRCRPASALRAAAGRNRKAHPRLFNVLLQIMDHGRLTDHNGKQVSFRNVILIMTTNAGLRHGQGRLRLHPHQAGGRRRRAINRLFAPEFRNRLDAIITFAHLSEEVISKVVEKFVMQLEAQLADRNVTIELSEEAAGGWSPMAMTSDGRAADGTRDPGAHQEAARRRCAVRAAEERRACACRRRQGRGRQDKLTFSIPKATVAEAEAARAAQEPREAPHGAAQAAFRRSQG